VSDLDNALAKTVLVRDNFGRSWLEGRNSHIRVRVAMYGVLLLLVVLGALRGVLSQQWQDERQLDIEILQSVAEQRLTAQLLGLSVEAVQNGRGEDALLASMQRLRKEAAALDGLLLYAGPPYTVGFGRRGNCAC